MARSHVKYLLLGGGLASSSAAEAIRARDADGTIVVLGQEHVRPYHRPPLSKQFLRGQSSREQLSTLPSDWFQQHDVLLRTGERAAHIEVARRTVLCASGDEIAYDKLLIATGASAKHLSIPGEHLPNVHYLRTLADADRLHHAIEKALHEGRPHAAGDGPAGKHGHVAIIGGGLLGVELAATLTQLGLAVDLLVNQPHPWHKFAGEVVGKFLARYLEARGVRVHADTVAIRLEGDGRVQRVVTSAGEALPCDFVGAAVGMLPNKELVRGTPIVAEKAILIDERCRTNVPDIYAAGDCAALFDPLYGKHRNIGHWDNARVTGQLAGTNMAGGDEAYSSVSYFFSDAFGLSLSAWGEARLVSHRIVRGSPSVESPDLVEIGIGGHGRVKQVLAVNHGGEDEVLRELVARKVCVEGKEELLKNPETNLADLLGG